MIVSLINIHIYFIISSCIRDSLLLSNKLFILGKECDRKISFIIKQYQSELKTLKNQYDKSRIEALRTSNVLSKIVKLNWSQELFISEIK